METNTQKRQRKRRKKVPVNNRYLKKIEANEK